MNTTGGVGGYEKAFIISNFNRFIVEDYKAVRKNKRRSPGFQPARARDMEPICSRLRGQQNCKFPTCVGKKSVYMAASVFEKVIRIFGRKQMGKKPW